MVFGEETMRIVFCIVAVVLLLEITERVIRIEKKLDAMAAWTAESVGSCDMPVIVSEE